MSAAVSFAIWVRPRNCTFADRWRVVELLREGKPYREIYELTGVSVTTVGHVTRFLADGNGGYQIALQRLDPSH